MTRRVPGRAKSADRRGRFGDAGAEQLEAAHGDSGVGGEYVAVVRVAVDGGDEGAGECGEDEADLVDGAAVAGVGAGEGDPQVAGGEPAEVGGVGGEGGADLPCEGHEAGEVVRSLVEVGGVHRPGRREQRPVVVQPERRACVLAAQAASWRADMMATRYSAARSVSRPVQNS